MGSAPSPRLAVLGQPVGHSLSPAMHNAALQALGATRLPLRSWTYVAREVPPADLPAALPSLHAEGFVGLNLTIPHKVHALDLCARVDPDAAERGAVNTLLARPDGWHGHNTDGHGFARAVRETLHVSLDAADVVLLGAGGAARAIAVQALRAGARSLTIVNRDPDRLADLLALLNALPGKTAQPLGLLPGDIRPSHLPPGALLVNATALGLKPDDPSPLPPALLRPDLRVYDTTYGCDNALARAARAAATPYADGLSMLVWQGAFSFQLWTGLFPPVDLMMQAARHTLALRHASA